MSSTLVLSQQKVQHSVLDLSTDSIVIEYQSSLVLSPPIFRFSRAIMSFNLSSVIQLGVLRS